MILWFYVLFDRPYVNVAYYNNAFGPADLQLVAVVIWIPLQVASLLVYPSFKVQLP